VRLTDVTELTTASKEPSELRKKHCDGMGAFEFG
jgi:hypothetical protein